MTKDVNPIYPIELAEVKKVLDAATAFEESSREVSILKIVLCDSNGDTLGVIRYGESGSLAFHPGEDVYE